MGESTKWLLILPLAWFTWQITREDKHPWVTKLLKTKKSIGLTSRGDLEEYWCAIKHTLHLENHLEEMIAVASSRYNEVEMEELMLSLDEARTRRQALVKVVMAKEQARLNGKNQDLLQDYWCAIKHLLITEGHIEEMLANAARLQNLIEVRRLGQSLSKTKMRRIRLIQTVVTQGDPQMQDQGSSDRCDRCISDIPH